jgi:hypothetical protein
MLIAELHGKRCAAIEGNEDYLTSAAFGHLRNVRDGDSGTLLLSVPDQSPGNDDAAC